MPFSPARPNGVRTPSTKTTSRSMPLRLRENSGVEVWTEHLRREEERYRDGESRLPDAADADARQRQLTRLGNAAAGAGLALVMAGRRDEAREWFARACERYRESWTDAPPGSWGRPIAILKARVLAGDWEGAERDAAWTLEQGADDAQTPIGRYAAALAFVASPDPVGYVEAIESVLESFESRDAYLEDLPAADTVVVLQALAERRGIAPAALESPMLPR